MSLRLAVIDMVGTTVHAGDEVPRSFRDAFESVGLALSDEAIAQIRGRSKREAISELLEACGRAGESERVYARFQETLRAAYRTRARPIRGAEDTFRYLFRAGVDVVLITGLDRGTADLLLHSLGWDKLHLTGMITGSDIRRGRPAPDLIEAAMSVALVDEPRSVLVVGDTASDLEAAAAANVDWSVGVLSGAHSRTMLAQHPHSVLLNSIADMPQWIEAVRAMHSA
jgi:phosphonatase-like hydrolase